MLGSKTGFNHKFSYPIQCTTTPTLTHTHPHAARLQERFHDKEEKVRMEVVRAISEAAADNIQAIPQSVRCLYAQSAFCTQDTAIIGTCM